MQQAHYSRETSLKGKWGNQYLIQNALICNLGTTFGSQFHPSCSGEIMEFVMMDTECLRGAGMRKKQRDLSQPPLLHLLQDLGLGKTQA